MYNVPYESIKVYGCVTLKFTRSFKLTIKRTPMCLLFFFCFFFCIQYKLINFGMDSKIFWETYEKY